MQDDAAADPKVPLECAGGQDVTDTGNEGEVLTSLSSDSAIGGRQHQCSSQVLEIENVFGGRGEERDWKGGRRLLLLGTGDGKWDGVDWQTGKSMTRNYCGQRNI